MSADNWERCPHCQQAGQENADTPRPEFREDYEIYGAGEGTVVVSYSGSCHLCPASLKFECSREVPARGTQ